MSKLQKILSLLLALVLLQAPFLSLAEEEIMEDDAETEAAETPEDVEFPEELIVGHPTVTKGDFFPFTDGEYYEDATTYYENVSPVTNIDFKRHQIMLTLGYSF